MMKTTCACLVGFALFGCGGGGGGGSDNNQEFPPDSTWTVLVYGHGDHNLSPSLVADIDEMKAATTRGNVTVIVLADFDASQQGFPSGGGWLKITNGMVQELETVPEPDLDDPAVLTAAIEKGFMLAPADRHALVMWNHGGAWEGGFGGDTNNGTVHDPGMTISAAGAAVRAGLDRAGIERLDVFAFDTCLLGGLETAAELAKSTKLYVANGEIDYGPGLDYKALLTYLSDHPGTAFQALATAESSMYATHHKGELIDLLLHAHVAYDLDRMPDVMSRARDLVAAIDSPDAAVAIGRAMFAAAPNYNNGQFNPEGHGDAGLHDVGQVIDLLAGSNVSEVASAARDVKDSLGTLVLASSVGELRKGAQIGINVELTSPFDATPQKLADYRAKASAWDKGTGWSSLIESIASFADDSPPTVTGGATGNGVDFQVDDPDVADVKFELGEVSSGVEYGYGFVTAGAVSPGTQHGMEWTGDVFAMQTANGVEAVYTSPWALSYKPDGSPQFKMMFTPGIIQDNTERLAMLLFDPNTGEAPVFAIFEPQSETWATQAATEYMGKRFVPILPAYDANGNANIVRLGAITISGDLAVGAATMNPGSYRLNLFANDLWGNQALYPYDVSTGGSFARRTTSTRAGRQFAWLDRIAAADRAGNVTLAISPAAAPRRTLALRRLR